MKQINLFFSYSHKDESLKEQLITHLSMLKRRGIINSWHDRMLVPGEEWDKKIKEELENADIILLLLSPDFINSNYCYENEVVRSVERHDNNQCITIPIMLRECDIEGAPFEKLQGLPKDFKPVLSKHWFNVDEAFKNITDGIKKSVEKIRTDQNIEHKKKDSDETEFLNQVSEILKSFGDKKIRFNNQKIFFPTIDRTAIIWAIYTSPITIGGLLCYMYLLGGSKWWWIAVVLGGYTVINTLITKEQLYNVIDLKNSTIKVGDTSYYLSDIKEVNYNSIGVDKTWSLVFTYKNGRDFYVSKGRYDEAAFISLFQIILARVNETTIIPITYK